ncbi:nuclear transport factor 2 family protein [Planobispora takensis]|uniref:Ketosteroid isomerase n=1 Tax=Planobispora takensis TaxID=1367882 RepID=A0A8J3WQF2_9ACTN|nr:nuclear transport factor 2 family protein [Planobispora takensis]GIH98403.1 ketosteroid isomerase [Planobispora takensis]
MPDVIDRFYTAARQGDGAGILALLHPEFEARTAPGLPCGAGGVFHGPREALTRVWGAIFAEYDTAPYAESRHETTDGTTVVTGTYRGTARASGRAYEAEFVHLWRVTDGRISWLHQYTDTARWHEALTGR